MLWATLSRAYDAAENLARRPVLVGLRPPVGADVCHPLRAVIFDLDALADIECEGIAWPTTRPSPRTAWTSSGPSRATGKLLALSDERQRVSAELRKRSVATESDVLTQLLADDIYTTKTMMFDEMILDADLAPRPGLVDLVMEAFAAGVCGWCGHRWPAKLGRAAGAPTGRRRGRRNGGDRRRRQEAHAGSRGLTKPRCGNSGYPRRTRSPSRVPLQGCGRRPPRVWPPWSSPATARPDIPAAVAVRPDYAAASRCASRIANGCTAVGRPARAAGRRGL